MSRQIISFGYNIWYDSLYVIETAFHFLKFSLKKERWKPQILILLTCTSTFTPLIIGINLTFCTEIELTRCLRNGNYAYTVVNYLLLRVISPDQEKVNILKVRAAHTRKEAIEI